MQSSVVYELTVFGGAGAAGVLIAFLYDIFRLKRRIVRTRTVMVHIEDTFFWLIASIVIFLASYIISSGETRAYFYAGAFLGALLYIGLLSKPVLWLLTQLIKIIAWPICKMIEFMKPVIGKVNLRTKKIAGKIRNRLALEGYRIKVDFVRLRNTFTKK
ncbi:MAG: hypothetical protein GX227_09075 [Clostridiaceae bacterium]|jgi:spore cortex biosynthesis protein YabQ|nr:hypothetical protein [Clostridiaceae bacterium]